MAYEIKDNTASLFINDKREKESHPQLKGSAKVDGVEYWVSAWEKQTKEGKTWFSISLQKKDDAHKKGLEVAKKPLKAYEPKTMTKAQFDDLEFDDAPPF